MSDPDERERARAIILQRRAKLVAYAVAAGVAMPACGGESTYCLSPIPMGGTGGASVAGSGGRVCLSVAGGPNSSGGPAGGTTGGQYCLSAPLGGETYCLTGGVGGETYCLTGGVGGAAGEGAAAGQGGGGQGGGAGEGGDGGASGASGDESAED